jgi:hypothetical protein
MDSVQGTGVTAAPGGGDLGRRFAAAETELMRRLEAEPQVSAVTFAMTLPGDEHSARIEAEGVTLGERSREARVNRVDVNFFRVFEVPVLAGREFEPADAGSGPESAAVVVNQPFAQKMFGGDALGRRIRYVDSAPSVEPGRWYEIVGIVSDFPAGASPGMRDINRAKVYHAAAPGQLQPATISIRIRRGVPASVFGQRLREIAGTVDPELHLRDICGLDEAMRSEQWISRMTAAVFVAITLSVLLLSSAGIYALMSFTVSQRRREVGIRIALGADGKQIVASVFSRAVRQLGTGAVLGAAFVLAVEKTTGGVWMRGNAAIMLPLVTFIALSVGFLAALGPTRRSLRIQPTEALKEQ